MTAEAEKQEPSPVNHHFGRRTGRKPTRVTWTYQAPDGSTTQVCPSDDSELARVFRKMLANLSYGDLLLVESLVALRRAEFIGPELARAAKGSPMPRCEAATGSP